MAKSAADYARERRDRGLCCSCGEPAIPGTSRCEACREKARQRYLTTRGPKIEKPAQPGFDVAAWGHKRYESRKAAGLCVACGKFPPEPTTVYCLGCAAKQIAHRQRRASEKVQSKTDLRQAEIDHWTEAGLCVDCGSDRFDESRCRVCLSRFLVAAQRLTYHEARKQVGLCVSCDNVSVTGTVRCEDCKEKRKQQQAERKEQGRCIVCGEPNDNPDGQTRCTSCVAQLKQEYAARREAGICVKCRKEPVESGRHVCVTCKADNQKRDRKKYKKLREQLIEAYGGACQCCGETTVEFLQVDHVNNDGAQHRKEIGVGGTSLATWLRIQGFPQEGFQLLCANCNFAKGHSPDHTCPHQRVLTE